jgi:hypothetical protein
MTPLAILGALVIWGSIPLDEGGAIILSLRPAPL